MTLDDLVPDPSAAPSNPPKRWRLKTPLVTPSGDFPLFIRTGKGGGPPSAEMLQQADEFVAFVRDHHRDILREIHEDYLLAGETEGFLKSTNVPEGLTLEEIAFYAGPIELFVGRSVVSSGLIAAMSCNPKWSDHGCDFVFSKGRLEGEY